MAPLETATLTTAAATTTAVAAAKRERDKQTQTVSRKRFPPLEHQTREFDGQKVLELAFGGLTEDEIACNYQKAFEEEFENPETSTLPEEMVDVVDPRHGKIRVTKHVYSLIEKNRNEDVEQLSDKWFEKRNNHVTASIAASICGDNKYESRAAAIMKKTGRGPIFKGNAATRWGQTWEDKAIEVFEKRTNEKVLSFGLLESLNKGEEFMAGSPDGITSTGMLVEVKTPYRRKVTSEVPTYYIHQVQFLMHILRLRRTAFLQFWPENAWDCEVLNVTYVDYDPYFCAKMVPKLRLFWEEVRHIRMQDEAYFQRNDPEFYEEEVDEDGNTIEPPKPLTERGLKRRRLAEEKAKVCII